MGREISQSHFHKADYRRFEQKLQDETDLAITLTKNKKTDLSNYHQTAGFELELFFVDNHENSRRPVSIAPQLLQEPHNKENGVNGNRVGALSTDPHWTYELGTYQVEYNSPIFCFRGTVLSEMQTCLEAALKQADQAAQTLGASAVAVGSLPTLSLQDLSLSNMAPLHRYKALNEQLLRIRKGEPLHIDLDCHNVHICQPNAMLESCSSSTQWHWGLTDTPQNGNDPTEVSKVAAFNAGLLASAVVVAVGANSPFICGNDSKWVESRILLLEACYNTEPGQPNRFFFGSGFVQSSLTELLQENLNFPVLLPTLDIDNPHHKTSRDHTDDQNDPNKDVDPLAHLALHNGSVWRWHRPIVSMDVRNRNNTHMDNNIMWRIEHRTLPSGPTPADSVANAALYYGLVHHLQQQLMQLSSSLRLDEMIDFDQVRENFYRAARDGLEATITWGGWSLSSPQATITIRDLLLGHLLDIVQQGLLDLELDTSDVANYVGILRRRVSTGQTGAVWQQRMHQSCCVDNDNSCSKMLDTYLRNARSGVPVAEWPLE